MDQHRDASRRSSPAPPGPAVVRELDILVGMHAGISINSCSTKLSSTGQVTPETANARSTPERTGDRATALAALDRALTRWAGTSGNTPELGRIPPAMA
jgi:hypothetical protein